MCLSSGDGCVSGGLIWQSGTAIRSASLGLNSSDQDPYRVASKPLAIAGLPCSCGRNSCNSLDCQPAPYQVIPRGVKMLVDGRWIDVPPETIKYIMLPDDTGGGHWCGQGYKPGGADPNVPYVTKCAILPPHGQ
jgi:hypothetical protein